MIRLMNSDSAITGPINIGNPVEFTILELAQQVKTLVGSGSNIVTKPLPSDDPKQRRPDISLAKSLLGWEPTVALNDGLKPTVNYFKSIL
jgi:UDP-glucuronate decarboxylase